MAAQYTELTHNSAEDRLLPDAYRMYSKYVMQLSHAVFC